MSKITIPIEKRETEELKDLETVIDEEVKTLDDVKSDEVIDKVASDEVAESPLIKLAPAVPGAPNNMIQKHVDNFLAKIAGETPVDDKPRNSTEFWLNEIAENLPGGGNALYIHNVQGRFSYAGIIAIFSVSIITKSATPFTTDTFHEYVKGVTPETPRYTGLCVSGVLHNGSTGLYVYSISADATDYTVNRAVFIGSAPEFSGSNVFPKSTLGSFTDVVVEIV